MRSKKLSITVPPNTIHIGLSFTKNEASEPSSIRESSDTIKENIYDPYEHRILQHPNTHFGAVVHIIKGSLGTGVLAVPRAFKTAGLVTGFIGTVLLVSFYHPPAASWGLYFLLVLFVLLLACCQIRELKRLVPFSVVANLTMVTAFLITLYYMIGEMATVDVAQRHLATSVRAIPSYFSTVLFAMEGIGTILPVENSMTEGRFLGTTGALNVAMAFVVTCHSTIGFCGYYAFGEDTDAAVTQNLPSDQIPAQVVQGCISASMFFTFMLNHHVPTEILWRRIQPLVPSGKHNAAQVLLRLSTVTFAMMVAAAANRNLDALMDLVGAVCFSILGLFIPAVVDILVNWKTWGKCHWMLVQDGLLIVLSAFALVSGTYYAL